MLRKKTFTYANCRNMTRHDQQHFDWRVERGFFAVNGDNTFAVTAAGRGTAELGLYDWEPAGRPAGSAIGPTPHAGQPSLG
ncbi:hypothetical protein J0H58_34785 [bacterium]|nr:hypothetical protein [bacterium]